MAGNLFLFAPSPAFASRRLLNKKSAFKFRVAMSVTEDRLRSLAFSSSAEPRFWWHRLASSNYVPPVYSDLTEEEWRIIRDWFAETSRGRELTGECAVPIMS